MKSSLKILFFAVVSQLIMASSLFGKETIHERQIKVSMRMIGHQTLLNLGDSTSRVLPIEKDGDRYKIPFESEFSITPDDLFVIIHPIIEKNKIASQYIVELEKCNNNEVVYSYEFGISPELGLPCRGRILPEDCYTLFITLVQTDLLSQNLDISINEPQEISTLKEEKLTFYKYIPYITAVLLIGFMLYFRKKRPRTTSNQDILTIGAYRFDKRNMVLSFDKNSIELTSKESDLLLLLHDFANETIKREVILNKVWEDEGDYIGRTLDVYISKLRKKLEADANIKIINIRGVGYKMILNN